MELKKLTPLMALLIVVSTLVGFSHLARPSAADAGTTDVIEPSLPTATITVTGTAQLTFAPDLSCVYLRIETRSRSAEIARSDNARIANDIINALEVLGIDKDSIETTNYQINPEYDYTNGQSIFKDYVVINSIKVTVKNFDKIGRVIDTAVGMGALIDSVTFELSKPKLSESKTQSLAEAAKDAKSKAEAVVQALGKTLGNLQSITCSSYDYTPQTYYGYRALDMVGASSTPIQPENVDTSASVTLVYEVI